MTSFSPPDISMWLSSLRQINGPDGCWKSSHQIYISRSRKGKAWGSQKGPIQQPLFTCHWPDLVTQASQLQRRLRNEVFQSGSLLFLIKSEKTENGYWVDNEQPSSFCHRIIPKISSSCSWSLMNQRLGKTEITRNKNFEQKINNHFLAFANSLPKS